MLEQQLLDYLKVLDCLKCSWVDKLIHVFTLQQGSEVAVSAQVVVKQRDDVHVLLMDINRMEDELKMDFPVVRWTFFELDLPWDEQMDTPGTVAR